MVMEKEIRINTKLNLLLKKMKEAEELEKKNQADLQAMRLTMERTLLKIKEITNPHQEEDSEQQVLRGRLRKGVHMLRVLFGFKTHNSEPFIDEHVVRQGSMFTTHILGKRTIFTEQAFSASSWPRAIPDLGSHGTSKPSSPHEAVPTLQASRSVPSATP
ncbi:hypothetical protein GUJ93_ZPchr0001g33084 [Zizania palustris]|uniref:Uncharacterized protein n=1 Tax=Zizania palustris TaxID=103762 RepID=A0A8J5RRL5_ZIZPA|nr:hypothetical protein GUJ93_ZPchr0001g33084 [Zizania palustris]